MDNTIDIHSVFENKNIHLSPLMEKLIGKLFHIEFFNNFLIRGYRGREFCVKALEYFDVKLKVTGLDAVPKDGTLYTFVSNHPLGGIDGVALAALIGDYFQKEPKLLVNDFLMNIKGLAPLFVPVNMIGKQARCLSNQIDSAFFSDNNLIVFPSGLCSRKIDGVVQDLPWKKMFVSKSVESGRSIVPVHFIACNSRRFYFVANLCKRLRIKANLAMALLPDEMYRSRHGLFRVVFGHPIPSSFFDGSKTALQWASWLRCEVYRLD